jgi:hypothetical protein
MSTEVLDRPGTIELPEQIRETEENIEDMLDETGIPPIFGRCPVCRKPLNPRCRFTGVPTAPPIGQGHLSRAKCDKCGAVIEYVGNGKWEVYEMLGLGSYEPEPGNTV